MAPNTSIVLSGRRRFEGHNFSGVYLKYRGGQIVSDIQKSLGRLAENNVQGKESPCLAPPKLTLVHKMEGLALSVIDPVANKEKDSIVFVATGIYQSGKALAQGVYSLTSFIASATASVLSGDNKNTNNEAVALEAINSENISNPATSEVFPSQSSSSTTEVSSLPSSSQDKPASSAGKLKQAEESLQDLQKQLFVLQSAQPSRLNLDGAPAVEETSMSRRNLDIEVLPEQKTDLPAENSIVKIDQKYFDPGYNIPDYEPGFGGGGGGGTVGASSSGGSGSSSSSLPAEEAGSSSSSESSSSSSSAPDTVPPAISSLTISECQNSLSSDGCLVAITTLNIAWNSTSTDLAYFIINNNGAVSATTSTSTIAVASRQCRFSFAVSAKDLAGNYSATSTQTVEISTRPVVINEVAWAGNSAAYSADEWIELYNRTGKSINLANWILYSATDLSPYITLSGSIAAKSYYLIERSPDNATISDIVADLAVSFGNGLNNSGESLILSYASSTIDQVPYCYNWCGGSSNYYSMERYDPDTVGTDASNWGTNNLTIRNGRNAGGGNINGTPKARNSVNYLINKSGSVSSDLTLSVSRSPYLVDNALQTFNASSTLTIEPGVVIKFYNNAGWQFIAGAKILVQGTAANPIIFTSFYDDGYAGDTNGDATSTSPSFGNWYGLRIDSPGAESIINNAVFRYGGRAWTDSQANLHIANSSATITNSVFEYAKVYGVRLSSASTTFSGNIFRSNNNSAEGSSTGLYAEGGNLTINSNSFSNNKRGLYFLSLNSDSIFNSNSFNSNTFTSNTSEAVSYNGKLGSFSNNSGSGNGVNAISLSGTITQNGATTTLAANSPSLPYLLNGGVTVAAGSAFGRQFRRSHKRLDDQLSFLSSCLRQSRCFRRQFFRHSFRLNVQFARQRKLGRSEVVFRQLFQHFRRHF